MAKRKKAISMADITGADSAIDWHKVKGTAGDNVLKAKSGDDRLYGKDGDDLLLDRGKKSGLDADAFFGGDGNDRIHARWGNDYLSGGAGDDRLVSRADAGEPVIGQNPALPKQNPGEPIKDSSDLLRGGAGADKFVFRLDLNARMEIILKHTSEGGEIDWEGVAGENDEAHLHWVEGIGTDTIADFNRAQGDVIIIEGHTVEATITHRDSNADGIDDYSVITLKSNQGGAGSHDQDQLGRIIVRGDLVECGDLCVNAGVHYGVAGSLEDLPIT